jgi:hypothetical protein
VLISMTLMAIVVSMTATAYTSGRQAPVSLLVKLRAGLSSEEQQATIARLGGVETNRIDALRLHTVDVDATTAGETQARFANDPDVERVTVQATHAIEGRADENYGDQWALDAINWPLARKLAQPQGKTTIAVLDTGVDGAQPDLEGRVLQGHSAFVGQHANEDDNGHGTWMATIAAAQVDNGAEIAGVSFANTNIFPVRVLDDNGKGKDGDIIAGVIAASDAGADVILMAFSSDTKSADLQDAIDYAWSKGAVLVAATGNDGKDVTTFPAGNAKVIGVAATDRSHALWTKSNRGVATFLSAPGVDVIAGKQGGGTQTVSGTSASAAMVAGAAAVLKANDADLTNATIAGRLARGAQKADDTAGHGRLDLARSLTDGSNEGITPTIAGADGRVPQESPVYAAAANSADLAVTAINGPLSAVRNDPAGFTFAVDIFNWGPQTATGGFQVVDTLPAGATFLPVSSSPGCLAVGQVVTCVSTADLAALATRTVNISVVMTATVGSSVSNNVTVTPLGSTDSGALNNTALLPKSVISASGPMTQLVVTPDPNTVQPNTTVAYTATGADAFGNLLTNQTSGTTFAISSGGTCSGRNCRGLTPGAYVITATKNGMSGQATLTAAPWNTTTTAAIGTVVYGSDTTNLSATVSGATTVTSGSVTFQLKSGTTDIGSPVVGSVTNGAASVSYSIPAGTAVGSYTVSATYGGDLATYAASSGTRTFTVTRAPLNIKADNASRNYGAANPTFTATYTGLAPGDTPASLGGSLAVGTPATATSNVGTYTLSASGRSSGNYTITYSTGVLTVAQAPLVARPANVSRVYATANPAFTVTYSGFVNGHTSSIITGTPLLSTTATTSSPAGSYAINLSGLSAPSNYSLTMAQGTLTVTPAVLTVAVDGKSKVYGSANPAFTSAIAGFVNGDNASSLGGQLAHTTAATVTSPVGSYPVTASGLTSNNYTFNYVNGSLTVTKATLAVSADNTSVTYGSPIGTLTAAYTGFVGSDGVADINTPAIVSTAASSASPAGAYPVTVSGAADDNYSFTYTSGVLTITKAALVVRANDAGRVYGASQPTLTATGTGFVNGDTMTALTTQPTVTTTATASSPAGAYVVTAAGAAASNYSITYATGVFTVTKAPLTVTADNKTRTYGDSNPAFTFTATGFVNGDNLQKVTGQIAYSNSATADSNVGNHSIAAGGLASLFYDISYVDGTLRIDPATLTIRADDQTSVYGSTPVDPLTWQATGWKRSDTQQLLTGTVQASTTVTSQTRTGAYATTVSGAADVAGANYAAVYVPGVYTVTKAPLTLTVDDATREYALLNPGFGATAAGLVNDDTQSVVRGTMRFATSATPNSPVGTYVVTVSGATADDYNITFVPGTLTITKARMNVAGTVATVPYGANIPLLRAVTTRVGSNTTSVTASGVASTATPLSLPGTYPVVVVVVPNSNYEYTVTNGSVTITKAPVKVTANNQTISYGRDVAAPTATFSGLRNGDTATTVGALTVATTAVRGSQPGTYPIDISGLTSDRYDFQYVSGTVTVNRATLRIMADSKRMTYGQSVPLLTIRHDGLVMGETLDSLDGQISVTTAATSSSGVGSYVITVSGLSSPNYDVVMSGAALKVEPARLVVVADHKSMTYGDAMPALTATYSGFVNGDDAADLGGRLTLTSPSAVGAGSYPITASGVVSSNYTVTYMPAKLVVAPAALVITVDNASMTKGSPLPAFTVSYSGFVRGDTSASLRTQPRVSTKAGSSSKPGTYALTATGVTAANYRITYAPGTLTIS